MTKAIQNHTPAPSPDDHLIGDLDAPVKLVEYGDYQCPYCRQAHGSVAEVVRRTRGVVCFAYRHFPLVDIHPHARLAAEAAVAAAAQGSFWPMHDVLYEHQGALRPDDLAMYAGGLGLDVAQFVDELREGVHRAKVDADRASGMRSGVTGTPTFFIDGARHEGAHDTSALLEAIDAALARKNDLVDEAGAESFPASDPPPWTRTHAGPPLRARRGRARSHVK